MKTLSYKFEDFLLDIKRLYEMIQLKEIRYDSIIAVTRGGMVPSGFLSQYLNIKKIHTCGGYFNEQGDFSFINEPRRIQGRVILISDLLKTGKTLELIINSYLEFECKDLTIDIACIHYFPNQAQAKIVPNFFVYRINENMFINYPWE